MVGALRLMDPALLQRAERVPRARGQVRQALRLRAPHAGAAHPAGDDGRRGHRDVQLPGAAAAARRADLARNRRDVRGADRRDGGRLGDRRAGRGRARPGDVADAGRRGGGCSASPSCSSALAPTLELQALALVPMGAASVTFAAGVNSSLQLAAAPALRGRVMSLYSIVFLGSTPIGAPLVGWLADVAARAAASSRAPPRRSRPRSTRAGRSRARTQSGGRGACAGRRPGAAPLPPRARCAPRRLGTGAPLASRLPAGVAQSVRAAES